jgi:hypothetical protein
MDPKTLKELITELLGVEKMLVVVDSSGAAAEMDTGEISVPDFDGRWATIEARGWHVHLDTETVDGAQFVEAEDRAHDTIPKLYYVRLSAADGGTVIRFYFPNPWLDDDEKPAEFQPDRLLRFEQMRDRYVDREGVESARRAAGDGTGT